MATQSWGKAEWVECHQQGYKIYSVTPDEALRQKIVATIKEDKTCKSILVPGCGSLGLMENHIAQALGKSSEVLCTDFQGVVDIAAQKKHRRNVRYDSKDSTELGFSEKFDAVIPVNAVVSGIDEENRAMIGSFFQALKPGGRLVGLFPTIMAAYDVVHTGGNPVLKAVFNKIVDMEAQAVIDLDTRSRQIYYSPLKLRGILMDSGFSLDRMEIVPLDSPYFMEQGKKIYGLRDCDPPTFELLVVARKPEKNPSSVARLSL